MKRILFVSFIVMLLTNCKKEAYMHYVGSYRVSGTDTWWLPTTGYDTGSITGDTIVILEKDGQLYINSTNLSLDQSPLSPGASPCSGANCFGGTQNYVNCFNYITYDVSFPSGKGDFINVYVEQAGCGLGGSYTEYYMLSGTKF